MADEDDPGTRYAFLLQPIRDLQKNWDIDISHLLDEFVERMRELNNSTGAEDTGPDQAAKFNFAEAAVLIQGSTMVYGKKVEYVHGLARDFYEQLKDKKSARRAAGGEQIDEGGDMEADLNEAAEDLDDPCQLLDFTKLRAADWKTLMLRNTQKPPPLLPQIPVSLLPLADFEKTNVPLYSSRNLKEVIGRKDDFIINTGFIHRSGALLLDPANEKLLDDFAAGKPIGDNSNFAGDSKMQCDEQLDVENQQIRTLTSEVERGRHGTSASNFITMTHRNTSHVELVSAAADCGKDIAARSDLDTSAGFSFEDDEGENYYSYHPADEEVYNDANDDEPMADLFKIQKFKHAPYQSCKPTFDPEQITKRKMAKRRKLGLKPLPSLSDFLQQHVYRSLPKGTVFCGDDDFTLIFRRHIRKLERQRTEMMKKRVRECQVQTTSYQEEADVVSDGISEQNDYGGDVSDFSSDDSAGGAAEERDDGNLTFANMPNDDLGGRVHISSLYMNFDDPDLALKPSEQMTYQDLLKVHLQKYWSSAEETTSKLCKRVQQWEEKIQPLLEEEETRREFNIHQYGTELLEQYEGIGQTKDFAKLVTQVEAAYEISRYFLASLMLANTGNVQVESGKGNEKAADGKVMMLKLMKKDRHHDVFNEADVL